MEQPFVGVIELLKTIYSEDEVRTGTPVPASVLVTFEREHGVKLPDDYKQFVQTWGYLCAGPLGNITVWGIASEDHGLEYEVDVRRATELLKAEVAERAEDDEDLAQAMRDAGAAIPAVGWAEDFPGHTVHVFDAKGNLRWFLVKEHSYDEPTDTTFTEHLHGKVQAALEKKMNDVVGGALGGLGTDDTIDAGPLARDTMQLSVVPAQVVAALQQSPCASDIRIYRTLEELTDFVGTDDGEELPDDENGRLIKRVRAFLAALGPTKPEVLSEEAAYLMPKVGDALSITLQRAKHPAAMLFGAKLPLLRDDDEDKCALLTPEQLRSIAGSINGLEKAVRDGYDVAALRAANALDEDADADDHVETLVSELDAIVGKATEAAERGWGWLVEWTEF